MSGDGTADEEAEDATTSASRSSKRHERRGLVMCHGLPQTESEVTSLGLRAEELADRIAKQVGMYVLAPNLRGTGESEGNFSLQGWCDDVSASVAYLRDAYDVRDVWLTGFGVGAAVALIVGAGNTYVRGVATFAARARFDDWYERADQLIAFSREMKLIRDADFPADVEAWRSEFRTISPIDVVAKLAPRPLLLVHGANDTVVPIDDARALAQAAGECVDARTIQGAGHRLRHDPRVVAILLGWLDDQH